MVVTADNLEAGLAKYSMQKASTLMLAHIIAATRGENVADWRGQFGIA